MGEALLLYILTGNTEVFGGKYVMNKQWAGRPKDMASFPEATRRLSVFRNV